MIKLVVSDLDGTLLNTAHELSVENLQAIDELRKKGIMFTIATGRAEQLIKRYTDILNLKVPAILYNGSMVIDLAKNHIIFSKFIPNETVIRIKQYLDANNIVYMIYTKDAIYSKPNERVTLFMEHNEYLPENQKAIFADPEDLFNNKEVPEISKILIVEATLETKDLLYDYLQTHKDISITNSQKDFIDINPLHINKGIGIEVLAEYLHIKTEEIAVIGDQDNDLSMLKKAGLSIAMGNAIESVKDIADYITLSCDDNGVAHAVNHFLFDETKTMIKEQEKFTLTEDLIHFCDNSHDFSEGIRCSCEPLLKNNYVTPEYVNKIIQNAKEHGPYIALVPNIAIPHTRPEDGSLKKGYSVTLFKNPIHIENKTISIMIAVSSKNNDLHLQFLQNISKILHDQTKIDKLLSSSSKKEILELFKELEM